jgi:transposase
MRSGVENQEVAARLWVDKGAVGKWRRRLVEQRMDGLHDEPRSGAPRLFLDEVEAKVHKGLDIHIVWHNYATHKTHH